MKTTNNFIYDINKICEFIFNNPDESANDVEITENYTFDNEKKEMVLNGKVIKEVKTNDYTVQTTMRYDLVKMFIEILNDIEDTKIMTLGQSITLNTMEAYELIKKVN